MIQTFNIMGATKTYVVIMKEQEYCDIPAHIRENFISDKVIYDDYEEYKDNEVFQFLYRAKRKATKDLYNWKFDQRNDH